jgi:hypothetical protein
VAIIVASRWEIDLSGMRILPVRAADFLEVAGFGADPCDTEEIPCRSSTNLRRIVWPATVAGWLYGFVGWLAQSRKPVILQALKKAGSAAMKFGFDMGSVSDYGDRLINSDGTPV